MWSDTAWDWLVVAGLYAFGLGAFAALGGFAGATRALKGWGRSTSIRRAKRLGLKLPPNVR